MTVQIIVGDCLELMRSMPEKSINCCVTSPPYWGLRDYGVSGQLGLESTPAEYVNKMVFVFREVRRVLRDDGTLWLNIGDSYSAGKVGRGDQDRNTRNTDGRNTTNATDTGAPMYAQRKLSEGFKHKDLIGIPWMLAFALRADGWYLRQDIIWAKPNPMPESVRDRCTKSHEYIFLLSKSEKYYYDQHSIMEPTSEASVSRLEQPEIDRQTGSDRVPGKTNGNMKAVGNIIGRNKRSVWTITTQPFKEAHFATFPPKLINPCILAGCPEGGMVLDPFGGAGTTGLVSDRLQRNAILLELNPDYAEIAKNRIHSDGPLFSEVT